jgi:hypothetical protein
LGDVAAQPLEGYCIACLFGVHAYLLDAVRRKRQVLLQKLQVLHHFPPLPFISPQT